MTKEFELNGFVMSEHDEARLHRQLLGVMMDGETETVKPPPKFLQEIAWING